MLSSGAIGGAVGGMSSAGSMSSVATTMGALGSGAGALGVSGALGVATTGLGVTEEMERDCERLRAEVKDLTEKLQTLIAKRAADKEKQLEAEKLKLQLIQVILHYCHYFLYTELHICSVFFEYFEYNILFLYAPYFSNILNIIYCSCMLLIFRIF